MTIQSFEEIASQSAGSAVFLASGEALVREILTLAFGRQWANEIDKAIDSFREGFKTRLIRDKRRRGEVDWLVEMLKRTPVHPEIVDGLIALYPEHKEIARRVLSYLYEDETEASVQWACIYILRRIFRQDFQFDPGDSVEKRSRALQIISRVVRYNERR